ncbi:MAG TPA: aldo/keto reductase [Anaerolineaceae bacterium]|nr:aldo/keto reductase [Anaerolineaceae bacterium]
MNYRRLGKTDLHISEIGFGAWGIGGGWGIQDDAGALAALRRAFDLGVNFYDTAAVYGDGHSETLIGQAFHADRDKVIIASKIPPKTYKWPVGPGTPLAETFPRAWIIEMTERSLKNLGTDYLDLQQLHAWTDDFTTRLEWREAFEELKKQGKIRAYGVSVNDWDPYGGVNLVKAGLVDSVQVIYNIFEQRPDEQLLPAALEQGVGILARVPFEEGVLTGAFKPGHVFEPGDWRKDWLTPERLEIANKRLDKLRGLLDANAPDLATLALKFILSNPAVTTTIPGMRKLRNVEANARASDGRLLEAAKLEQLRAQAFWHGWYYPWSA